MKGLPTQHLVSFLVFVHVAVRGRSSACCDRRFATLFITSDMEQASEAYVRSSRPETTSAPFLTSSVSGDDLSTSAVGAEQTHLIDVLGSDSGFSGWEEQRGRDGKKDSQMMEATRMMMLIWPNVVDVACS